MDFLHQILGNDLQAAGIIILNLIIIESLLSIDNAAVLATMVMDLPKEQRDKALKYGLFGAYFFRGICLLFATYLIKIWWLKPLGGLYLLYLAYDYFKSKSTKSKKDDTLNKEETWFYKITVGKIGKFWSTIVAVEIMDLAFSLDNIFAVVAFTENIYIICIGVFIGILAMRFVAQSFVKLLERFPFMESLAFIVIGILGLKLTSSIFSHFYPDAPLTHLLEGKNADMALSALTAGIFFIPLLTSYLFNFPKKNTLPPSED